MSQKTMQYLRKAIPAFTMLQDESRQDMLMLLYDKEEMTVNQLTDHMSLSRPTVSKSCYLSKRWKGTLL